MNTDESLNLDDPGEALHEGRASSKTFEIIVNSRPREVPHQRIENETPPDACGVWRKVWSGNLRHWRLQFRSELAPRPGLEPGTIRLTVECSTN